MRKNEFRMTFDDPNRWFAEKVNKVYHKQRIATVIAKREYLSGQHKILLKEDAKYKGKELIARNPLSIMLRHCLIFIRPTYWVSPYH